jgi:hypothetical protein
LIYVSPIVLQSLAEIDTAKDEKAEFEKSDILLGKN